MDKKTATRPGRKNDEALTCTILEATWEMLSEGGYVGVEIGRISRKVGCAKTTIYRRWPSKAELVAAALLSRVSEGEEPDTGSVVEDLVQFALVNSRNQQDRVIFVAVTAGSEVLDLLWAGMYSRRQHQALRVIDRGIARKELPAETDAMALIDLVAGFTLFRNAIRSKTPTLHEFTRIISALVASPPLE